MNVVPDVLLFVALLGLLVGVARTTRSGLDALFGLVTLGVATGSVLRITRKALRTNAEDRLRVSVFTYGFVCGALMWFMFVLSEWKGSEVQTLLYAGVFITLVGAIAGGLALLASSIIRGFIEGESK